MGFIESIFAVFVIGSWFFWAGVVILVGLMLYAVEGAEHGLGSFLGLVVTLFYLHFAAKLPVFESVRENPLLTVGSYVLGGIVYSFLRWAWHCRKFRSRYEEVKAEFARRHNLDADFDPRANLFLKDHQHQWRDVLYEGRASELPIAAKQKKTITMWMMYWPWSLLWTVLSDFVVRLWENIYTFFSAFFQGIANKVLGGDVQRDFKV